MINNSFCTATWFNVRNDNDGSLRPCTNLKGTTTHNIKTHTIEEWRNSDFMQKLREDLANNKRPKCCECCWDVEDIGLKSHRDYYNEMLDKEWMKLYFNHCTTFETNLTLSSDIKTGNKCNLACAMCSPEFSSKIHKTWSDNPNPEFTMFDTTSKEFQNKSLDAYLDELFKQPLQFINIFGGEPIMEKRIINKLLTLPDSQKKKLTVNFITNGTFDIVKYAEKLKGYKAIHFAVSIDSTDAMNDYIRRPSDFKTVKKHLLSLRDSNLATMHVFITIQALNIFSVQELIDMLEFENIPYRFLAVTEPTYLSLDALPKTMLEEVKTNNKEVQAYINDAKFKPVLYEKFKRYIKWYEKGSNELRGLQPELYSQKSPN